MIEYFSSNMWQLWAIVALVCLIIELTSGDFFFICFTIGGLASLLTALCCDSLAAQAIVFAVVSVLSIFFIRPLLVKHVHKSGEERTSNVDALIGREGIVTEAIEAEGYGRVKIDGDSWKACTADGAAIGEGSRVKVVDIKSVIITVEQI